MGILNNIQILSIESHCEVAALRDSSTRVNIITLYRSPRGDFLIFLDVLEQILKVLNNSRAIVCGDFNVRFGTDDVNSLKLCNLFGSFGYSRAVDGPTRVKNCLDNIFTNFEPDAFTSMIYDPALSDHAAQEISVSIRGSTDASVSRFCRPITMAGRNTFFSIVGSLDWAYIEREDWDIHVKFETFVKNIGDAFRIAFPEKLFKAKDNSNFIKGWYNNNLKPMRNNLQLLNNLYKRYKTDNLRVVRSKYRSWYNCELKRMKTSSLDNYIIRANNKSKAVWDYIRFKKGVSSAVRECNLTANDFNDFFVRVGPKIISNIPPSPVSPEDLIPLRNIPSFSLGEGCGGPGTDYWEMQCDVDVVWRQ
ncbi:hypothetical protein QE152_g38263 [Popillia japonica]|uniref:Endonuclease/exonuclease/phosphatase domain-containing protein n=1 Tax=Popillia japonica TaxID=7064 RepID=A0AAW1I7Z7_POPJA